MNKRLQEALDACDIMSLATMGPDGPWVSPVKYNYNEACELTFVSYSMTKHAHNIHGDDRVSAAIFAYPRDDGGNVGLQIKGHAKDLDEETGEDGAHRFVLVPDEIWLMDTRYGQRSRELITVTS